ncbi:inactive leucine-rich repeat receptor-like protein kinase [Acorus gramineus]|uniref:Inactive leucine-rich repeat receptor-like protein kinase n=1 Tax=Acorus gramineus TaxID=55184 RepID=A0AAV8ZZJ7_ACOGR|nr:inactive leucine-rich repeat receptor-like protein kinase [Acorus gramineus]
MRYLDLSENAFRGLISASLLGLNFLEYLHLQHNNFSGLMIALTQKSLRAFNVSKNNLSGRIPPTPALLSFNESSYAKNPGQAYASKKECESEHTNDNKTEGEESASLRRSLSFIGDYKSGDFDIRDLLKASAEGLGKGSFRNCYKVTLDNRRTLVVKRLRNLLPLTSDEFARHMSSLADAKHPNLLPFLGYFFSDDEKLLVSRFAPNRSLFERIHETVPHGNLKTSNILLDEDGTPLVSDYGLRLLVSTTIAVRTMASYKSPEYKHCRRVGHKSDVWSYGCVLLEIITGRMSSHSAPEGMRGIELCGWVNRAVREEWTGEVFDVEIRAERGAMGGVLRLLNVALRCCERVPEKRTEMAEVLREIEGIEMTASDDDDGGGADGDSEDRSFESVEGQRSNAGLASVEQTLTRTFSSSRQMAESESCPRPGAAKSD